MRRCGAAGKSFSFVRNWLEHLQELRGVPGAPDVGNGIGSVLRTDQNAGGTVETRSQGQGRREQITPVQ
jgi:hypothetical protein